MQMNPIGWFEIYVDDMMRAKAFYEAVFNVTLDKLDFEAGMDVEMWVFPCDMDSYGATGALCYMSHVKAGGNSTWSISLVRIVRQKQVEPQKMVELYKCRKWPLASMVLSVL